MRTIREAKFGRETWRLVDHNGAFAGIVVGGRVRVDGEDADDVWRRLHDKGPQGQSALLRLRRGAHPAPALLPGRVRIGRLHRSRAGLQNRGQTQAGRPGT